MANISIGQSKRNFLYSSYTHSNRVNGYSKQGSNPANILATRFM